jgi:hypothetical protein
MFEIYFEGNAAREMKQDAFEMGRNAPIGFEWLVLAHGNSVLRGGNSVVLELLLRMGPSLCRRMPDAAQHSLGHSVRND